MADEHLPDPALIDRLVTTSPGGSTTLATLEAEFLRRAASPERRAALRRLLLACTQEADEYLGASAGAARHYLARLDALSD